EQQHRLAVLRKSDNVHPAVEIEVDRLRLYQHRGLHRTRREGAIVLIRFRVLAQETNGRGVGEEEQIGTQVAIDVEREHTAPGARPGKILRQRDAAEAQQAVVDAERRRLAVLEQNQIDIVVLIDVREAQRDVRTPGEQPLALRLLDLA